MAKSPSLAQWQHHRVRTIEFVSGAGEGKVEPAHLTDLIYGDPANDIAPKVPNELVPIAERVEFEGIDAEAVKKMSPAERLSYQRFKEWLVADRLRSPEITAEQARTIPTDDFQQVLEIALHMDYRERVMLRSFRGLEGGPASDGSGGDAGGGAE